MKITKKNIFIASFVILLIILICIKLFSIPKKDISDVGIVYLFWTGGYDSTFRLCQALIDENKVVQPIYISDIIDNLPQNSTRRQNKKNEYEAMKKIVQMLHNKYPRTRKTLLPLKDIKKITVDDEISYHMRVLKSQGRVRRAVCQYGAMAQVTKNLGKNIEICVENEPGSMLNKTMKGQMKCLGNVCYLKDRLADNDKSLEIFRRFIFSTIKFSKEDMLKIAEKGEYDDILKVTWSCWYPRGGKPCGRCIMCRERIV